MKGSIYHVCNRGIAKGKIFLHENDYYRFVFSLFKLNNKGGAIRAKNYRFRPDLPERDKIVEILKWSLLPNHYHILLYELVEGGVVEFVKRLGNSYTKYFNIKYERSGYLFQNKAKVVPIIDNAQFLYIPLYVELNPLDLWFPEEWRTGRLKNVSKVISRLSTYRWSSFANKDESSPFYIVANEKKFFEIFDYSPKEYMTEIKKWLSDKVSTCHVDTIDKLVKL